VPLRRAGLRGCAVLNTLNTRLDAEAVAFILNTARPRCCSPTASFARMVKKAIALAGRPDMIVIDVDDPEYTGPGERLSAARTTRPCSRRQPDFVEQPADEWEAISLNYTSGTTGNPKGVVYHHRGAYLNAMSNIVSWGMPPHSVYLWTLPMFHCNGWCFAVDDGGQCRHQRLPAPRRSAPDLRCHPRAQGVTHYCGAPIVHSMLANAPEEWREGINHKVSGWSPPRRRRPR
jgi:fatty-acyl-CoA synthase